MKKFFSFASGILAGLGISSFLMSLFSPVSADEFKQKLEAHYDQAMEKAREASLERRVELEAELAQKSSRRLSR